MRRITQKEFDNVCNGNHTDVLRDCVIGEDIVFPKKIGHVRFINCALEKSINDVSFYSVSFNNVEIETGLPTTIFTNCKFRLVSFKYCDFTGVAFGDCDFCLCSIEYCKLSYARFIGGFIRSTSFMLSNVECAMFNNINACDVTFDRCNIERCEVVESNIALPQMIPSDGSFIAWKKAVINTDLPGGINTEHVIVKLRIPEDAQRVGITNKCRADRVEVLGFETLSGEKLPDDTDVRSWYDKDFHYKIGVVKSDWFCDKPNIVCGEGIHFFLNKTDAINYKFT